VTLFAVVMLHLIPAPARVERIACNSAAFALHTVASGFDPAAMEELDERWSALGLGRLRVSAAPRIVVRRNSALPSQGYRLTVLDGRALIESSDAAGAFYGAMTLAQLPQRSDKAWSVPCVRVEDRPALRWRILSDDVSRGPIPTMRYFEERIRTIAAFKMNGYSPYMEHVFLSPSDPLPALPDGITPAQLRELARYAERFHVALIPDQQTFAHMHGTLRVEQYAPAAKTPHGFVLDPAAPLAAAYLERTVRQELEAVGRPPFFHIGSDDVPSVTANAFAAHVRAMSAVVAPSGARIMLWDDAIQRDPGLMSLLPRDAVIVDWHYGAQANFSGYIDLVARGGFDQMVAPAANNWNEIFPDVAAAVANESAFIAAGKVAGVLGMFETVWHDDGESLYEATWYPVLYAAATAWQPGAATTFPADFPSAFFGVDDPQYATDVAALAGVLSRLQAAPYDSTDALFWSDVFDSNADRRMANVDLRSVRLAAESVATHLYARAPPLHAGAAFAMFLAARRYDALARKFQIAAEARDLYADAVAHAADEGGPALHDLFACRYLMWELRDADEDLASLYERAWRYEDRDGHLAGNLERYHMAAQRAIELADELYRATYDGYVRSKTLPPFDEVVRP
jgi:hexosaminidase